MNLWYIEQEAELAFRTERVLFSDKSEFQKIEFEIPEFFREKVGQLEN